MNYYLFPGLNLNMMFLNKYLRFYTYMLKLCLKNFYSQSRSRSRSRRKCLIMHDHDHDDKKVPNHARSRVIVIVNSAITQVTTALNSYSITKIQIQLIYKATLAVFYLYFSVSVDYFYTIFRV